MEQEKARQRQQNLLNQQEHGYLREIYCSIQSLCTASIHRRTRTSLRDTAQEGMGGINRMTRLQPL